ncbi:MAG: alpha-glucan family phosphorylase [Pseudomonadales bacterium]|nr:alpha-glucan family phosphorylase [Pseudomonadales bacterium]
MQLTNKNPIAYFCAEFGFDSKLPIYAGGLGVLSGDTIKQAAEENLPFVGIGLLYRGYGVVQNVSDDGMQTESNYPFDPTTIGLEHVYKDEMPLFIKVHMTEVDVWVRCWKKTFSENVTLYLLDTETDQNLPNERSITSTLYSGTQESLLKQQIILGIGGVKLLTTLGIHPVVFHMNEGRPNFLHWQLIREMMDTHNIDYETAKKTAKEKTVYTNHTLVAAGNQEYSMDLLNIFSKYYADKMGITNETLLKDGIDKDPKMFSITKAALNTSCRANGVSKVHSDLSKKNWPEYNWTNITNGVHLGTWQENTIKNSENNLDELWRNHQNQKVALEAFVKEKTGYGYDPNTLVITWARRLAGYKRLDLVFQDIERLRSIFKNSKRPIQLLVSGKAHQGDTLGKQLLQKIIGYMKRELVGHALYIPNYNIEIAQMLVKGSDVWLNTPTPGQEASGTSGMKAISNGILNLTTAEGWAAEVDWNGIGWVLDNNNLPNDLYEKLEKEVAPLFYSRNENNIPVNWLEMMQKSIKLAENFSAARMLKEYREKLYLYGNTKI